jgi:hypothetical protein
LRPGKSGARHILWSEQSRPANGKDPEARISISIKFSEAMEFIERSACTSETAAAIRAGAVGVSFADF